MEEQKRAVLIRPPLSCHCGANEQCPQSGKVTRLSLTYQSCFVQTEAPANDGEMMFLKLWLPDEFIAQLKLANDFMLLQGRVKGYSQKVGFGFQLTNTTDGEQEVLALLVNHLYAKSAHGN